MYRRNIIPSLRDALGDTPVALLGGARQTGKTTLIREGLGVSPSNYATLDDLEVLGAAASDPAGFLAGLSRAGEPVVLDEVQRAPGLFPAIKASVDRDRRPGRFLLTGSANVLLLPKLSESLAGRMEILTLWPLAQAEIEGAGEGRSFVDRLFSSASPMEQFAGLRPCSREEIVERVVRGGYPEPMARSAVRRPQWFESYLAAILQRDVRDLANIEGLTQMPRLLAILAARTASLLNASDISRTAGIPYSTLSRYLTLLETTYLVHTLPAWSGNLTTRLIKSPKIVLNDTGLAAHLLGVSEERLLQDPSLFGGLLENFVAMEILKDIGWSKTRPSLYHWHTVNREEADLLLERRDGTLVGVEVKASATVGAGDFKGLRALENMTKDRFVGGVVLYTGERVVPFGEKLYAVPLNALWTKEDQERGLGRYSDRS
jgi:predicted AAA+ superfamily ATPase